MDVTANSGSPPDIQAAINAVVAGGVEGTVYVPSGDFVFNPPMNGIGVTIPYTEFPFNIVGSGIGVTILRETVNRGNSVMFRRSWSGQKYSGAPVRISGMDFIGFVQDETATSNSAIRIVCTQDFRIHHCNFKDFASMAILTDCNTGGTYKLINRGLIDHCDFDNPYKDLWSPHNPSNPIWAVWGYGIIVAGIGQYIPAAWDTNIGHYLGQYEPTETYNGYPIPQPVYIEDCKFSRCRHAIASNQGGHYVSRHNQFEKCSPYGQNDAHGGGAGIFDFTDESYSHGQDAAIEVRGGGGVCLNNAVILSISATVQLSNDGEVAPYDVEQLYIWNNTAQLADGTPVDFNSRITKFAAGITQDINYFLRAPNQAQDGFTYTPYVYPHPLASGIAPPPPTQYQTPFLGELEEGVYKVTVPLSIVSESDTYNFKQWEDGTTNPVRTITLNQNIAITATYELYTPPPTTITLSIMAGANGSVFPTDTVTMVIGQAYQFQATPDSGYNFDHWDLGGLNKGSSNPLTITATAEMNGQTLTALFTPVPPTPVTIVIAVTGNGTTDLTPGSHEFHVGDTITIAAIPTAGYAFKQWTLNGTTYTDNPLNLPITESMAGKTLTAEFSSPTPLTSSMLLPALGLLALVGIGYLATRKKR
jgi:hypothetical protein